MKVTVLGGDEISVDDKTRARAFWLIQRHSSYAYMQRMFELLSAFADGYREYAMADRKIEGQWHNDNVLSLAKYTLAFRQGLSQVKKGEPAGYRDIRRGLSFVVHYDSPRYGDYAPMSLVDIGWRRRPDPGVGLWAWIERAMYLGSRVRDAILAGNALPGTVEPTIDYPARLPPMPKPKGLRVHGEEEFPITGFWLPVSFPHGCPSFFVAGDVVPPAFRAAKRIDYPPMAATKWTEAVPARSKYVYEPTETDWELLWEDHRYKGGIIPDESQYLDETSRDPPYPAHYVPTKLEVVQ